MAGEALDRLAQRYGIELEYFDIWDKQRGVADDTKLALLRAMGLSIENEGEAQRLLAEHEALLQQRLVDPVLVIRGKESSLRVVVSLPKERLGQLFEWTLIQENGKRHSGLFMPEDLQTQEFAGKDGFIRCLLKINLVPGLGYHWLEIRESSGGRNTESLFGKIRLIVTPRRCYLPSGLEGKGRVWGPTIQLYALSSSRNWGIGDFTDLKTMVEWCGDVGAGILGMNPVHSLFPTGPGHTSPYSPSSRMFLN